jgi:hypothetical protein
MSMTIETGKQIPSAKKPWRVQKNSQLASGGGNAII